MYLTIDSNLHGASKMTNKEELPGDRIVRWIFAVVIIAWIICPLILWWLGDLSERGQIGDQYGVLNALFSGLAFAALIITLRQQRDNLRLQMDQLRLQYEELKLQRRELEMTRNELAGSKQHLGEQSASLKKQNFETTFFEMVRLHHTIVEGMRTNGRQGVQVEGRNALEAVLINMRETSQSAISGPEYEAALRKTISGRGNIIDHYVRNFYCILAYVNDQKIDQGFYVDVVKAQLSPIELMILFYVTLFGIEERWMMLSCRYKLFQHFIEPMMIRDNYELNLYKNRCDEIIAMGRG